MWTRKGAQWFYTARVDQKRYSVVLHCMCKVEELIVGDMEGGA